MAACNLQLPIYLPKVISDVLYRQLLKSSNTPLVRKKSEVSKLKNLGASNPFLDVALASAIKGPQLYALTALIYDERMKDVWRLFPEDDVQIPTKVNGVNAWHILKAAILTLYPTTTARDNQITFKKDMAKVKGYLRKAEKIVSKYAPRKQKGSDEDWFFANYLLYRNYVEEVFLNDPCANIQKYESFRKRALISPIDYALITREGGNKQEAIRLFMGHLIIDGLSDLSNKVTTQIVLNAVSVILSLKGYQSDDISENEVKVAVKLITQKQAENANYFDYVYDIMKKEIVNIEDVDTSFLN